MRSSFMNMYLEVWKWRHASQGTIYIRNQIIWLTRYSTSICYIKSLPRKNLTLFTTLSSRELANDPCWLMINVLILSHFINIANARYYVSLSEIFADAPSLRSDDTRAEDRDLLPHIQVRDDLLVLLMTSWVSLWWPLIPGTCHHRCYSQPRLRRLR